MSRRFWHYSTVYKIVFYVCSFCTILLNCKYLHHFFFSIQEKVIEAESKVEEIKENGVSESEDAKTPESEGVGEPVIETEKAEEKTEETTEKKKEKTKKKKWSIRSISFSKKTKPSKDGEKNGEVKEDAVSYFFLISLRTCVLSFAWNRLPIRSHLFLGAVSRLVSTPEGMVLSSAFLQSSPYYETNYEFIMVQKRPVVLFLSETSTGGFD